MTVEQWMNSAQVADGRGHYWAVVKDGQFYRVESQDGTENLYTLRNMALWLASLGSYVFDCPGYITIDPQLFHLTEAEKSNL